MDVDGSVQYRSLEANVVDQDPPGYIGGGLDGITLNSVDISDVEVAQVVEKAALRHGLDAGDVFLAGRFVDMIGTVYGRTRPRFYDRKQELRRIFSARSAFEEDPANKGYLPLSFSVPTDRRDEFPSGRIDLQLFVLPLTFSMNDDRKRQGGVTADPLATPWRARLRAKDPVLYGTQISVSVSGHELPNLINRGDFASPVAVTWTVGATAGTITLTIAGRTATITVPAGAAGRTFSYDGNRGLLYVTSGASTTLRMDLIDAPVHPTVPVGGGTIVHYPSAGILSGPGTLTYRESYA